MTDAEWSALSLYVVRRRGRPPRDLRATWDAIFWVACSTLPWAALPPALGRAETHHSALLYAARTGILDQLMVAVSGHPLAPDGIETLEWRVVRAFLRASRQLPPESFLAARVLGLRSALYCPPEQLPPPGTPLDRPRRPDGPLPMPRIRRRMLRGLPPPRGLDVPPPAPEAPRPPQPRRPGQGRKVRAKVPKR